MKISRVIAAVALLGACAPSPAPAPAPAPAAGSAVAAPTARVLGTLTRFTMIRRVIDGGLTSGTDVLVVHDNGEVEHRDGSASGPVLKAGRADAASVDALRAAVARPDWDGLPAEKGRVVPDGPVEIIEIRGKRFTRHRNPDDEPVVRDASAAFDRIWKDLDR